jgi:formylglycine-generating enzyme required for sulfatase activity
MIPPGTFLMGSDNKEDGHSRVEGPQHEVEISRPFAMGIHAVTRAQFRAFMDASNGFRTEAEKDGQGGHGYDARTKRLEGPNPLYTWRHTGWLQSDDHPVLNVTWNDAMAFCKWLSDREGRIYDLPTEAEWEYACRAGTTTRFFSGNADASLEKAANIADVALQAVLDPVKHKGLKFQTWNDGFAFTAPVGSKQGNAWGLFDMHGNVWQWCRDGRRQYDANPKKDPDYPIKGDNHSLRGGSWNDSPSRCRSAFRFGHAASYRGGSVGFRIVERLAPPHP